jgi:hypothetical protein
VSDASGTDTEPASKRLTGGRLLAVGLTVVLLVQAAFVLSYVGALHHPKPHRVAFGVVGASSLPAAVARGFSLKLTPYPDRSSVSAAIDKRKIDGAFVAAPTGSTLIVVPAAGAPLASGLSGAFTAAAVALGQKIAIVQAHPLPGGDAGGNVSFLVVMALIVGGYLASTIGMAVGGPATWRRRLGSLAICAVLGALLTDIFAGLSSGRCSRTSSRGCPRGDPDVEVPGVVGRVRPRDDGRRVRGRRAPGGSRGGGHARCGRPVRDLRSARFRRRRAVAVPASVLADVRPLAAGRGGTTAVRNTIYFGGNEIATSLLVLVGYLVAGAL